MVKVLSFRFLTMEWWGIFSLCFLVGLFLLSEGTDALLENDKQALLDFVNQLPHFHPLNWDADSSVCKNWTGVGCNEDGSRVIALRLPGVGFNGPIPNNTLSRLSALQILSLRSNGINGSFPLDFGNLKNLSYLYLHYNNFSGPLPFDLSVWKNLTSLNLSNNRFNGTIPSSISGLSHLTSLNLANNSLSGTIPDINLPNLQLLNLSNNNLIGTVPKSLQRFPKNVFIGNDVSLLGYPVSNSSNVSLPQQLNPKSKNDGKLSERALLGIIVASCVIGILGFGFLMVVCCFRRKKDDLFPGKMEKGDMSPEKAISRSQDASNRLVFFEGCNYAFDLEDLLRASAEVLGKGTFGMAYKAILEDATTVVVKRLKDVGAGKKEFEQQMEIVGSIKHENVVELRAYYYSKDEKLTVSDYFSEGSVAAMLHGKRGEYRNPLDWETRLRIAVGASRGIARIHAENGGKLVHGNVKSSNIFLNSKQYGCVSDVGLSTIMSSLAHPVARAAGFRAPEITDTRKATQPSDVYSFGVLLLELLTGKSPIHTTNGDEIIHLVRWVHSVVREEWTAEVFDLELLRYPNIEEEMVEMLQIAMSCVVRMADQRPKMCEVVKMIENVRPTSLENQLSSEEKTENSTSRAAAATPVLETQSDSQ
ncbi:putative inactive receptor kinase [Capsicum annuum]|uniref:Inactive receptor kinase n=1 Tax=Capsicum annuum TaxID=4072 RepID=A0A2G3ADN1_CAPAN|nr:probable inactive receptor kinase At4g23740 [Capsicum annuum]KAF3650724.1 putative inactive receptor kinase [Capsicum annuum]KAF3684191.1 putative inactive receptor kinase [Capsicum annuum]PHT92293.1 putative inactive receptor kinase [Capsicum annuum]